MGKLADQRSTVEYLHYPHHAKYLHRAAAETRAAGSDQI